MSSGVGSDEGSGDRGFYGGCVGLRYARVRWSTTNLLSLFQTTRPS